MSLLRITIVVLSACLLVACSGLIRDSMQTPEPEPTPRPTYTPYPTHTPQSRFGVLTISTPGITKESTQPTHIPSRELIIPISNASEDPDATAQADTDDLFAEWLKTANKEFNAGNYESAIDYYNAIKKYGGESSATIENRIGLSYDLLEQYDRAIEHYSLAIDFEDSAGRRIIRGFAYYIKWAV